MNIIEALNRLRSDIQTWTANNLKTKVNADDLSTSVTTGTLTAGTIIIDGQNIKNFIDNNYVTQINPTGSGNVSFGRKSGSSIGNKSVVIGDNSEASNDNSIAIGTGNVASGENSVVIGTDSTSSGWKSVVLGDHNIADNEYAFATGCYTKSHGIAGSTFGNQATTNTNSWCAMSSGIHTVANGLAQHVFGMNNIPDPEVDNYNTKSDNLLIVGNGDYLSYGNDYDNRYESNAMTLDWSGNAWFSGDVYVGSTSGTNKDSGSVRLMKTGEAYTKSESNNKYVGYTRSNEPNIDEKYDAGIHMISKGTNLPAGYEDEYGVVLTLPYRQLTGNKKPDYGCQIFMPNGDDEAKPNSMMFRTSLENTWNPWQEVATTSMLPSESTISGWGFTKTKGTVTKVSTGSGLTGGDITSTGTIKCNLVDFTQNTSAASASGSDDDNRLYPVSLDKNGKLSVKVPWVKVSLSEDNAELNEALSNYITKTDIDNYIPTLNGGQEAVTGKYVSGVTVSGHTVTVTQESLPEEQYKGTVTSVTPGIGLKLNGKSDGDSTSITTSGTIDLQVAGDVDVSGSQIGGIKVKSIATSAQTITDQTTGNNFPVRLNTDNLAYVTIPTFTESYKGTVTSITPGIGLTRTSGSNEVDTAITTSGTINLKMASTGEIGGIKTGFTVDNTNKNYPVVVDKNGNAYVNVPWAEVTEETLPDLTAYKKKQSAVTDPTASTDTSTTFIDSITQNADGVITATKKTIPTFKEQYTGTVTSITPGTGLTGTSSDVAITDSGTINLKTAATNEIGGIKVGSVGTTSSGANKTINANKFAIHVDKDGLGYVAIPEYSNGTGSITKVTAGTGLTGGASSGEATLNVNIKDANKNSKAAVKGNNSDQLYAVELDKDGKLAVSVPWKSTTFEGNAELEGLLEPYALKTDIPSIAGSGFATTSSNQDTNTITVNVSVPNASTSVSGLMSAADKVRLDGIEDNANNYVHPSVNHIPSGGSSGQFLKYKSSGEAQWYTLKSSDIPAHTHSYVTSVTAGEGLNNNGTDTAPSLSVKLAEDNSIGGFKTGFENNKNNRNYGVKIDSSTGKAYVNVPWEAVDFSGNAELSALLGDYAKKEDIPSLSGGTGNATKKLVSGVTVSGHTVTVNQKTIAGEGTVTITDNGDTITIYGADTNTDVACTEDGHYSPKTEATGVTKTASAGKYISSIKLDSKNHVVGIGEGTLPTFSESYKGTVTSITLGTGLTGASSDSAITTSGTINLKTSSTTEIGGIKVGSVSTTASNANKTINANKFAVHVDKDGLGYVAIPAYSNISNLTLDKVTTDGPSGTSSVASSGHTHSVTASGSVSSSFTGSPVNTGTPSSNTTSVATGAHTHGTSSDGAHTHTVTATGSVSSSFTGTSVNTGTDSSNVASVSLDTHKHTISATGTTSRVSVPTTSHTHNLTISGSGSFTGTAGNTGGPSANTASVASGTHTHSVTGTVESGGASHTHTYDTYSLSASASGGVLTISLSTGSGNVGYTIASHTHVFASGSASATATTNRYDVPNTSHTHSFTPSGSVSFSGSDVTTGSASTASGHTVSVATGAHVHSMGTAVANDSTSSVSVSTSSHKHSVTASGSVSSSFTGTSATTSNNGSHSHTANASINDTTNRVSVPNTSHTHSVTAAGSVSSSFTGTAVTSGTPSGTTSVGSSSHTHTVTPTGSIS